METFTDCSKPIIGRCGTPPNFADGSRTSNPRKFTCSMYMYVRTCTRLRVCSLGAGLDHMRSQVTPPPPYLVVVDKAKRHKKVVERGKRF